MRYLTRDCARNNRTIVQHTWARPKWRGIGEHSGRQTVECSVTPASSYVMGSVNQTNNNVFSWYGKCSVCISVCLPRSAFFNLVQHVALKFCGTLIQSKPIVPNRCWGDFGGFRKKDVYWTLTCTVFAECIFAVSATTNTIFNFSQHTNRSFTAYRL